jgi:hypothetical protein
VSQFPYGLVEFVDGTAHQRRGCGVTGQGIAVHGEHDIQVQPGGEQVGEN